VTNNCWCNSGYNFSNGIFLKKNLHQNMQLLAAYRLNLIYHEVLINKKVHTLVDQFFMRLLCAYGTIRIGLFLCYIYLNQVAISYLTVNAINCGQLLFLGYASLLTDESCSSSLILYNRTQTKSVKALLLQAILPQCVHRAMSVAFAY